MIKNLIFDIGGVLVDWNPRYYFDEYFGGDIEKEEFFLREICGREINVWMDAGMLPIEAGAKMASLHPEWGAEINAYIVHWKDQLGEEIPGMYEYLLDLKERGFRIFGLSNWSDYTFREVRKMYRILSIPEEIAVSGAVGMLKPNPEMYRYLLDKYGLKASESIFIDDHKENVTGSEAVGIKGICFRDRDSLEEELGLCLGKEFE